MKKWLLMLLSILLIAAMALSFAACGDNDKDDDDEKGSASKKYDKDSIVGEWEGTVDYTELLGVHFEMLADVDCEFNEDGTCTIIIDAESMIKSMKKAGNTAIEDILAEAGMDMTPEEFLEMSGMTADEFFEMMLEEMAIEDTTMDCEYSYEDGVLILDGEEYDCEYTGEELSFDMDGMPVALERK
jgi:hypothetical protein